MSTNDTSKMEHQVTDVWWESFVRKYKYLSEHPEEAEEYFSELYEDEDGEL